MYFTGSCSNGQECISYRECLHGKKLFGRILTYSGNDPEKPKLMEEFRSLRCGNFNNDKTVCCDGKIQNIYSQYLFSGPFEMSKTRNLCLRCKYGISCPSLKIEGSTFFQKRTYGSGWSVLKYNTLAAYELEVFSNKDIKFNLGVLVISIVVQLRKH